jgi:hypothetical protein
MDQIFNDINVEFQLLFSNLNWLYIFLFSFLIHGIKNKEEFAWYNSIFKDLGHWKSLKIWIAGIILIGFFLLFHSLNLGFSTEYLATILRSWLVVIVFNTIITNKIKKIEDENEKN